MTKPNPFTAELRRHALEALAGGPVQIEQVVADAIAEHAALFKAEGDHLARKAAARIVKDVLRTLGEDEADSETRLPGFSLPSVIYVDQGDEAEPYYRRTDLATWAEIEAGLAERRQNLARADAKLKRYLDGMDRLRPLMATDPTLTVGEAIRRAMQADAA